MLDLGAIEARAEYKLAHLEGQGISLRDITWTLQDVLNLLAELRVARAVVEAAQNGLFECENLESGEPWYKWLQAALDAYRAVVGGA